MAILNKKSTWPPKLGVTIGKFKPFHKGHELMIQVAAETMQEVIVIVSDEPDHEYIPLFVPKEEKYMPLNFRYQMVRKALAKYPNVRVVKHEDTYGDATQYDEHGTAVDEEFWKYWVNVFNLLAPDATHFVSSDRYGQEAAKRITFARHETKPIDWFPVDPDRELVDISATRIRDDSVTNWKYIQEDFRQLFGKRILVIGPESTGKTTLTKDLGKALNSPVVPEYGRILSEARENNLDAQDFIDISDRHHVMENNAIRNSETGLAISDTDVYTTYLFSKIYLDAPVEELKRRHTRDWYDLVVLLPPTIPWDDDGTRVLPSLKERQDFYQELLKSYRRHSNLLILEETDRKKRVDIVCGRVAEMMGYEKSYDSVLNSLTNQDASLIVEE